MFKCLMLRRLYFSSQLDAKISPTRIPFLPVLSIYVGPIPFSVEPILAFPFDASDAASNRRWVGSIR